MNNILAGTLTENNDSTFTYDTYSPTARQVYGIMTAENALIFFQNGEPAYLTKCFDINPDNTKIKQEDFALLAQKTNETHGKHFKYDLTERSFLNRRLKRIYIRSYEERLNRLRRSASE